MKFTLLASLCCLVIGAGWVFVWMRVLACERQGLYGWPLLACVIR